MVSCLAYAAQEFPEICKQAEALDNASDRPAQAVIDKYGECLKESLSDKQKALIYYNLGVVYDADNNRQAALENYARSVRLDPRNYPSYSNMAWIQASSADPKFRDGELALKNARKACSISANLGTLDTYAVALARLGQYKEAAKLQQKLISEAEKLNGFPADILTEMKARLQLYEQGLPYTETTPSTTY